MKKKFISKLMAGVMALGLLAGIQVFPALADSTIVCTLGADLTQEQQTAILQYFGVYGNPAVQVMYVNNQNERDLLGSWIPIEQIGSRTISCALVRPTTSGGIQVRTANLNYITSNMIASNLATAGITNCEVVAAAPFEVSGTGALTGILMAYERSTTTTLDQTKADVAVQELVTTSDLASKVGQQEAQQIVNDIKLQIIEGNLESSDLEQVNEIVNNVITNYIDDSTTSIELVDNSYTDQSTNVNNTNITNNTTDINNTNVTNNTTNNYSSGLSQQDIVNLQIFAASLAAQSYDEGTRDVLAEIQKTLEEQTQKASSEATQQIVNNAVEPQAPASVEQPVQTQDTENSILNQVNTYALSGDGVQLIESATDQSMIGDNSVNLDDMISQEYNNNPELTPEEQTQIAINDQLNKQSMEEMAALGILPEGDLSAVIGDSSDNGNNGAEAGTVNTETPAPASAAAGSVSFTDEQRGSEFKFKVLSTETTMGQNACGTSPLVLELPYDNMTPVSGNLTVTDSDGTQVGSVNLGEASSSQISTVAENNSISRPAEWSGYTAVVMLPYDDFGSAFSAASEHLYTYTLTDAVFSSDQATVTVNCSRSNEYVCAAGLSIPGMDLNNISKDSTVYGVVSFPADVTYAEFSTDNDKVYTSSYNTYSDTAGVEINITGKGKCTLTVSYYADESSAQTEAPVYVVDYVLYIS